MHHVIFRILTVLCAFSFAAAALGQATQPASLPDPVEATQAVRDRLSVPITVDFDGKPLGEVLGQLSAFTEVRFQIDWPKIRELGIAPDLPITLRAQEVPASKVLTHVLELASEMSPHSPLLRSVLPTRVVIGQESEIGSTSQMIWLYDVHDLIEDRQLTLPLSHRDRIQQLFPLDIDEDVQPIKTPAATQTNHGFGLFDSADDDYESERYSTGELQQYLIEMIQDNIGDPTWWLDEQATIRIVGNLLVVSATPDLHLEIRQLLTTIRRLQPTTQTIERDLLAHAITDHLKQAEAFRQQGDYESAAARTATALRIDPEDNLALAMQVLIERSRPMDVSPE